MSEPVRVGFVGAGAIARAHAFALSALRYYYADTPEIAPSAVVSGHADRAQAFAAELGFRAALGEDEFFASPDLDTVFVLGPNRLHCAHARRALALPRIRRVYIEKPACVTRAEALEMAGWAQAYPHVRIQPGYQLLLSSAIQRAIGEWATGSLGTPLTLRASLEHSGYLDAAYREARASRMAPMPEGGALADLGSHLLSLAVAFWGTELVVVGAQALTPFADVHPRSDLHVMVTLREPRSGALGTVTASRIAAGHEDSFELEVSGTGGAVRVRAGQPDTVEISRNATRQDWEVVRTASDYSPLSRFPSRAVSAGWLRPLIHAHHLFLTDGPGPAPDLSHALAVQRLILDAAEVCKFSL
jgi:predicted dehydrogenase